MKNVKRSTLFFVLCFVWQVSVAQLTLPLTNRIPTINSVNVSSNTYIQGTFSNFITAIGFGTSVHPSCVKVYGSQTGFYKSGSWQAGLSMITSINFASPQKNAFYYISNKAFKVGEVITVEYLEQIKDLSGGSLIPLQYQFIIKPVISNGNFDGKTDYSLGLAPSSICPFDADGDGDPFLTNLLLNL